MLPCGDVMSLDDLDAALASPIIGVLRCSVCGEPVPFLHPRKRQILARKEGVAKVADQFFAARASLKMVALKVVDVLNGKKFILQDHRFLKV